MRGWSRGDGVGFAAVFVVLVAACSGDDGGTAALRTEATQASSGSTASSRPPMAAPPMTLPMSTTTPMVLTAPPSSTAPATTPAPSAVETLAPTDPGAVVGQQYLASRQRERELLMKPTLDDLEARVAMFAAPGSDYYQLALQGIRDLVARGFRFAPNDPPVDGATVESVVFEGDPPYASAILQTCDVSNDLKVLASDGVTVADPALNGVFNTYRHRFRVVMTANGWVRASDELEVLGTYRGQDTCDPL